MVDLRQLHVKTIRVHASKLGFEPQEALNPCFYDTVHRTCVYDQELECLNVKATKISNSDQYFCDTAMPPQLDLSYL